MIRSSCSIPLATVEAITIPQYDSHTLSKLHSCSETSGRPPGGTPSSGNTCRASLQARSAPSSWPAAKAAWMTCVHMSKSMGCTCLSASDAALTASSLSAAFDAGLFRISIMEMAFEMCSWSPPF